MQTPGKRVRPVAGAAKAKREAEELDSAFRAAPDDPASSLKLAQHHRRTGNPAKALAMFEHRARLGGFDQEVYYALLSAARLGALLGEPQKDVVDRYLRAFEFRPARHEAPGDLARYVRESGPRWQLGYLVCSHAIQQPATADSFYVEPEWQQWRCLDEYAVAAYWVGNYARSREACEALLSGKALPSIQRERVTANLNFALSKLGLPSK